MTQESLECDIVIVGAGPAGLAAAIRLKQLNPDSHIIILEKASEVGRHILSGAIIDPKALKELLPTFMLSGTKVTNDHFLVLTEKKALSLPTPRQMRNKDNYIISLSNLCRELAKEAEKLGVEIYPGFAATDFILDNNRVTGVKIKDMNLYASHTLLAEGCRGSLSKKIIRHYQLDKNSDPQTYALGVKEIWEIDPKHHQLGKVIHTVGWPLDSKTYGGSFIYFQENYQVSIGFVVGLDYQNSNLDPFKELQRFKLHPKIRYLFENAKRISYGARTLVEGGYQSLPKLNFPGGLLIGDAAGFLNVPKIKGIHMAMKSGMVAAESLRGAVIPRFVHGIQKDDIPGRDDNGGVYLENLKKSWVWEELYAARNIRPGFQYGLIPGLVLAAIDTYLFNNKAPWTLHHKKPDYLCTNKSIIINYPTPDNKISFDKLSSLYLSNISHDHHQPNHLKVEGAISFYDYCPAQVYEIVNGKLQINAQNCLHCKACDIKDPNQAITWTPPEGGSGPNYTEM